MSGTTVGAVSAATVVVVGGDDSPVAPTPVPDPEPDPVTLDIRTARKIRISRRKGDTADTDYVTVNRSAIVRVNGVIQ